MLVYAVDLGTTNTKVVLFDERLRRLAVASAPAAYDRDGPRVEFDPQQLVETVLDLISTCAATQPDTHAHDAIIAITGQAESLVLVGADGQAVRPAMSWLDSRAVEEAKELADAFDPARAFRVTGEPESSAAWPAAKLRWLARYEPDSLASTRSILMVKDDLIRRLTGQVVGELTTRGFTYFFDVQEGHYWQPMLDMCSIDTGQLPDICAAGRDVGRVLTEIERRLPPSSGGYRVNSGALDHFCAMVGTGSYRQGAVSESAGTVLSLSLLASDWKFNAASKISFHAGINPGDTVLFTCADSGGVVLEWFRRELLPGMSYQELEDALAERSFSDGPIFLPYLTGVNPPDFLPSARGAFLGLELRHDRLDMAYSVQEGVAHLLRRNVDYFASSGLPVREVVSTGGGAASAHWSQLKSDVCGLDVVVPGEQEATCRGAAALALMDSGHLGSLDEAGSLNSPEVCRYRPAKDSSIPRRYEFFDAYLTLLYGS